MITSKKPKNLLIGSPTGGTEALAFILKDLSANCSPIVISQHILPNFCQSLATQLEKFSGRPTQITPTPIHLLTGHIYIHQPESTLSFKHFGNNTKAIPAQALGVRIFRLCNDEMFFSYQKDQSMSSYTTFLTSMRTYGAQGLLALKKFNHLTIMQNQASCVVHGMSRTAKQTSTSTIELFLTLIQDNIKLNL